MTERKPFVHLPRGFVQRAILDPGNQIEVVSASVAGGAETAPEILGEVDGEFGIIRALVNRAAGALSIG